MDDTFIYSAVPTDADTVIGVSDAVTAMSLDGMTMSGTFGTIAMASTYVGLRFTYTDVLRAMDAICGIAPKPTAVEAPPKPKKPPPSLPVEAWATREFDSEQAHAATLALCRGQ